MKTRMLILMLLAAGSVFAETGHAYGHYRGEGRGR